MGHPFLLVGSTIGLAWLFASQGKQGTPGAPGETPFVSDPNAGLQQLGSGQTPQAPFGGLGGPTSVPAADPGSLAQSGDNPLGVNSPSGASLPFGGGLSNSSDPGGGIPDASGSTDPFVNSSGDSGDLSVPASDASADNSLPTDESGDGVSIPAFSSVAGYLVGGPVGAVVGACVGALASGAMDRLIGGHAPPVGAPGRGPGQQKARHPVTSSVRLNADGSTTASGLVWSAHARGWTHPYPGHAQGAPPPPGLPVF